MSSGVGAGNFSGVSTQRLIEQLMKNAVRRSALVDRIVNLDVPDKSKIQLIKQTTSEQQIDLVRELVDGLDESTNSFTQATDLILGRIPWELITFRDKQGEASTPSDARESKVYFIESQDSGLIKIGRSHSPADRFKAIKTMSPEKLSLLGCLPEEVATENELHKRFAHLRAHGEWFEATPELRDAIETLLAPAQPEEAEQ